jgi:thioredoxin-like negative regulator of GroEL
MHNAHAIRFSAVAAFLIGVGLMWPVSSLAVPFEKNPTRILEEPREQPVVMVFGAPWCGWCRKMESVTLVDEAVENLAGDFLWVKIDIEQDEELAAQFGVRGVPQTVILNQDGGVIGSVSGYVPPDRFAAFLTNTLESPQEPILPIPVAISQFLTADVDQLDEPITQLVTTLASPDRQSRQAILNAFQQKGVVCAEAIVPLLSHRHLAIRAAAAQALRQATGADLPFNPFAAQADRDAQANAWSNWLEEPRG